MICPICHRDGKNGYDSGGRCTDRAACTSRATSTMVTKPYVGGFNYAQAYRDAKKLGDTA